MPKLTTVPAAKPRISSKLRKAIELRIRNGLTIEKACAEAGLSPAGYYKAMKRPAVKEHLEEVQHAYIQEAEQLRSLAKTRAIEVALDLMHNAKSETIRARMAEFLASEGKTPQVAVHVDARQAPQGYEYVKPGQQVVEVVPQVVEQNELET
ncbi:MULTISPECIES: hypothetical protein [unclassified Ruegeria]|uniref:hypothetical protein n=1 Tax=unclassified Ruegeria TaxID=2625375 RepID=UPI0014877211|nr:MULTISPECIES: hypothetical protein [unclassified Ruegeria]